MADFYTQLTPVQQQARTRLCVIEGATMLPTNGAPCKLVPVATRLDHLSERELVFMVNVLTLGDTLLARTTLTDAQYARMYTTEGAAEWVQDDRGRNILLSTYRPTVARAAAAAGVPAGLTTVRPRKRATR